MGYRSFQQHCMYCWLLFTYCSWISLFHNTVSAVSCFTGLKLYIFLGQKLLSPVKQLQKEDTIPLKAQYINYMQVCLSRALFRTTMVAEIQTQVRLQTEPSQNKKNCEAQNKVSSANWFLVVKHWSEVFTETQSILVKDSIDQWTTDRTQDLCTKCIFCTKCMFFKKLQSIFIPKKADC